MRREYAGEGIDEDRQLGVVDERLLFQLELTHRLQALRLRPGSIAGDLASAIGDAPQVDDEGIRLDALKDGVPQTVILVNVAL